MWNDTDTPIGYLISFRAYGTWLHGDERGSTDRHQNTYGSPKYPGIDRWKKISAARLKHPPVKLTADRRHSIRKAIHETCEKRDWHLFAINVRTNHVHTVVSLFHGRKPAVALNAFKANATRQMREDGCWTSDDTPWADKGSERWLWTEKHLADAIAYVVDGQGDDLPSFD
jgi:REP element-mobilizing transposase RayT